MSEYNYTYKAFISYAQDPDKYLAKMLEDRIERFGINWHRLGKQKLYVFRDVTDLVPNNNLPLKIEEALSKSEFLIVLAQKKFSQNNFSWVNVETEYFIRSCEKRGHDPADYIILVITDGEVAWDRIKNQWDFNITNVIPNSLREIFNHEPLYVDLRLLNDVTVSKSAKNQVFRDAMIPIVAKLLYKKPSEIQNQIIKLQRYVIGFVFIILILISVISVYAVIQKDTAIGNAKEAKRQETIANKNADKAKEQEEIANINAKEAKKQEKSAVKNAKEAKKQEAIAVVNATEAKIQEKLAKENEKKAKQQEQIARISEAEAKRQEKIATTEKEKTNTINKLIQAENLALKALDYFKSLDDSLVVGKSSTNEANSLARAQGDSIIKAIDQFKKSGGLKKVEHKNKLETLYTSDVMSQIFLNRRKTKLDSMYNRIFQTSGGKTFVFNLNGTIFDTNNNQYLFIQKDNFVEATPVKGTDFIAYSGYNKNVKLFDVERDTLYQVDAQDINEKDVITDAFKKSEDVLILNSKNGESFLMKFDNLKKSFTSQMTNDKSMLQAQFGNKRYEVRYSDGTLLLINDSDTTLLKDVSSYCIDERYSSIFWGTPNGEVNECRVMDKNPGNKLISIKDRINKILIDQNNRILAVQVGANQLLLFKKFEWGYTKIYQETIGKRINDICLGNDGCIYILYDRNRLEYWPVKSVLFQEKDGGLAIQ